MTLRDKFFKECTDPSNNSGKDAGLRKINMTPHDLFEWFKTNMQGQLLPIDSVSVSLTDDEINKKARMFMSSGLNIGGGDSGWIESAYKQGCKDVITLINGK